MATLFNTRISDTYQGLIKTIDNTAITASLKELTDGSGNSSGIYMNTGGDFKVIAILEFGSLKDTAENIIISKFVDEADGIANNDNDTTIPTTAAIIDYVAAQITIEDLDFIGDTGTGQIDLDSQIFAIGGTTNEITTVASGQSLTLSLDSTGVYLPNNSTAITQTAGDNSTKIATTSYVDTLDSASDLDITDGTNVGDINLNTQSLSILGTTNEIDTVVSGQGVTIGLPSSISTNLVGNVTGNLTGDVTGDLTGNVTSSSVLANGVTATTQVSSDNSTKVATTEYVKGLNNASDLDFTTDSGSGAVVLNSETLSVVGTTNEIETSGTGQEIQIGLPSSISTNLVGNVTGNLTGNVVGDVTGDLTGNSAGTHTGNVIGNVTGNVIGDLTGNADTATAWQTARDLSVTGQASATITGVDGTSNVSAAITLDNNSVTSKVLTGLPTPAAASVLATDTIVQGIGKLQSQINGLAGGLRFMGSWDVPANNPTLTSGGGEADSGTTTATTANKLVDSTQNFLTTVTNGDQVVNQIDGTIALVTNVDSNTTLSLDADIMLTGEAYTIDKTPFITQGHYYVVSVGGTRTINGISNWAVGDWIIAGANNEWTKLDHTQIDGTGTGDANDGNIPRFTANQIIADSIMRETGGNLITVTGTLSTTGNLNAQGDFAVNTDKFTTQASTGNTAFTGDLAINTDKFTVNATNGNVDFLGDLAINTDKFTVAAVSGETNIKADVSALGEIKSYYNGANYSRLLSGVDGGSVSGFNSSGGSFIIRDHSYSQIVSDGNFGIGIGGSTAIQKVHIQGTGTTYMHIANDTTGSLATDGADIGFFTGQTSLQIINRENDSVIISTNDLPRLTIDGSGNSTFEGNVGINETSLTEKLEVNGAIVWKGSLTTSKTSAGVLDRSGDSLRIRAYGATAGSGNLHFRTGGGAAQGDTLALTLDSSQNATFAGSITGTTASFSGSINASGNSNTFGNTTIGALSASTGTFSASVTAAGNSNSFGSSTFAGNILFATDGTYDIGSTSGSRPRNVVVSNSIAINTSTGAAGTLNVASTGTFGGVLTVSGDTGGVDSIARFQNTNSTAKSTRIQLLDSNGTVGDALIAYDHSNASSALHYLGMGVNNSTTLVINNSDNVGIGTDSLDAKLVVADSATGVPVVRLSGFAAANSTAYSKLEFYNEDGSGQGPNIASSIKALTGTNSNGSGGALSFSTSTGTGVNGSEAEERMRIDTSGFTTITHSGVGASLTIGQGGNISLNENVGYLNFLSGDSDATSSGGVGGIGVYGETAFTGNTPSYMSFFTHANSANDGTVEGNVTEQMRISSAGSIGMGANSASYRLRVKTDATVTNGIYLSAGTGNSNHSLYVEDKDGTAEYFAVRGDGQIRNHASRVGDTLIGCTALPSASVFGSAFKSDSKARYTLMQSCNDTALSDLQEFFNPNGAVGKIQTSGFATIFNTASDYRLKEDLQDFAGLDMVSKIPVYDFKWKIDGKRSYGVMAHELQEILPDAAAGKKDAINEDGSINPQGVDYSKIVPLLVKSIQELTAKVEMLENKCNCKN